MVEKLRVVIKHIDFLENHVRAKLVKWDARGNSHRMKAGFWQREG